ncbi:MAG: hypothetical protein OXI71_12400 [Gemmatimonadota bacterium]|nr:hypothetical protein [Gemmatimonadota bacterium]
MRAERFESSEPERVNALTRRRALLLRPVFRRARRVAALVVAAVLAVIGCQPDTGASSGSSLHLSADECGWLAAPPPGDSPEAPCGISFREVARLEEADSITPYPTIGVVNGRYITATYYEGTFAFWAPGGELLDVAGEGPGEGPGEFHHPTGFAQVTEDELLVLTGQPTLHRYAVTGRFLRSYRLPAVGVTGSVVTYGDLAIIGAQTFVGEQAFALQHDSIRPFGVPARLGSSLLLAAADQAGVWSVEHDRYVLRRHSLPGGSVADSLVVARDWFPDPGGYDAQIDWFHADGRGLLWTVVRAADSDAPGWCDDIYSDHQPLVLDDIEAYRARMIGCDDAVVEALTTDGRLIGSVRFDAVWDQPLPLHGNLWFLPSEDMLYIVILEAVLTER